MKQSVISLFKKIPIHIPLFLVGSVVILAIGAFVLIVSLYPQSMIGSFFQSTVQFFGERSIIERKSEVQIERVGNQLVLHFTIVEEDQIAVQKLSEYFHVSTDWSRGIEISLDEKTLDLMEGYLPVKSSVTLEDKRIVFSSRSRDFLQSALPKEDVFFATGSGKLRMSNGENQFHIQLDNPEVLFSYATESGKLSVSNKVERDLFSFAEKIGTMELRVRPNRLDGSIFLK